MGRLTSSGKRMLAAVISSCLAGVWLLPVVAQAACPNMREPGANSSSGGLVALTLSKEFNKELTYEQNGGPAKTGNLALNLKGPIANNGSNCPGKNLANGQLCTVKLVCTMDSGKGEAEVKGTEAGIEWWTVDIDCE